MLFVVQGKHPSFSWCEGFSGAWMEKEIFFFFWNRSKTDSRKELIFLEEFIFQAIDINRMHGWRSPVVEQLNYASVDLTKNPEL